MRSRLLITALVVPLAGCASQQHEGGTGQGHPMLGTQGGNPASNYCVKQGGQLEIRQQKGGEVGYCHLPNGQVIEEWQLYRQAYANNQQNDS